jgi:curli production assembly/transport component CsgF
MTSTFVRAGRMLVLAALLGLGLSASVQAQDLVYTPKNPAFGGSPVNYQWMLNSAKTQNAFQGSGTNRFRRDPLEDFENGLQRQILSQLSRELVSDRFGNLNLQEQGSYDLGEFTVDVTPGLDGINIKVFNKLTGDESTITIPGF